MTNWSQYVQGGHTDVHATYEDIRQFVYSSAGDRKKMLTLSRAQVVYGFI
jgi:hypothetical protein